MSFVRLPTYRTRTVNGRPVKPDRKPKKARKKPWDDSVHDLSVYRATSDEMERRRLVHQSQNVTAVKQDQLKKRITKARKSSNASDSRRNALMKEVLFNHSQLEDVLARSDQVMAVVKDLFGDDPKKYRGLPRITVAPDKHENSSLPGVEKVDQPSKLDALSESIMDKTALNDLEFGDSADEEYDDEELSYRPVLDFDRFQKFLQEEQAKVQKEEKNGGGRAGGVSQSVAAKAMEQIMLMAAQSAEQEAAPDSPHVRAINDTAKVKRTMARTSQDNAPEDGRNQMQPEAPRENQRDNNQGNDAEIGQQYYIPADPSPEDLLHLQSLKIIVDDLEGKMTEYDCSTGRNPAAQRLTPHTISGYLLAVADNVSRLFQYLKQSELRLRAETTLREQLGQDVYFLKNLVDTLTEDIISSQEEHAKLNVAFSRFQQQHMQDIAALREELNSQGVKVQAAQTSKSHSAPLDNESVTMEDLAAHMQSSLQMANLQNAGRATSSMANGVQPPHQRQNIPNGTEVTQNMHPAYRLSDQVSTVHAPQPVHAQLRPQPVYSEHSQQIQTQQNLNTIHRQNELRNSVQSQGRPIPVFYTDSNTNGTAGAPNIPNPTKASASHPATLLSPPKQCDSPRMQEKLQVGVQQIQQVVQSMKMSNGLPRENRMPPPSTNQFAGLGHFHDVSGISSSVPSARPRVHSGSVPSVSQPSASQASSAVPVKKDEMSTRDMLQMQIAELNRQHAEAQQRIKVLYEEQQHMQKDENAQELISPPISPIPPASESEAAGSTTNSNASKILAGRGIRGITVSIPRVENILSPDNQPHQQAWRGVAADAEGSGGSQQASSQARKNVMRMTQYS